MNKLAIRKPTAKKIGDLAVKDAESVKGGESLSLNFTKVEYKYTPYSDSK